MLGADHAGRGILIARKAGVTLPVDYLQITIGQFQALSERAFEFPAAIVGAAAVTLVFLLLGIRRLRRMDVP